MCEGGLHALVCMEAVAHVRSNPVGGCPLYCPGFPRLGVRQHPREPDPPTPAREAYATTGGAPRSLPKP
eukprot:365034-Chlamydomonas_euryale.AAC.3